VRRIFQIGLSVTPSFIARDICRK